MTDAALTERGLVEAKLRECGMAYQPGWNAQRVAEVVSGALKESRKADVETVRRALFNPHHGNGHALAALSRLAGDE